MRPCNVLEGPKPQKNQWSPPHRNFLCQWARQSQPCAPEQKEEALAWMLIAQGLTWEYACDCMCMHVSFKHIRWVMLRSNLIMSNNVKYTSTCKSAAPLRVAGHLKSMVCDLQSVWHCPKDKTSIDPGTSWFWSNLKTQNPFGMECDLKIHRYAVCRMPQILYWGWDTPWTYHMLSWVVEVPWNIMIDNDKW